jgi:hypothetical protein
MHVPMSPLYLVPGTSALHVPLSLSSVGPVGAYASCTVMSCFVMRLVRMYLHRLFTGRRLPSFKVKAMPTSVFLCLVYFPFLFPLSNQSVLKEPSSPVLFALHLATYFTNLTWFPPYFIIHFKSSSLALERPFP